MKPESYKTVVVKTSQGGKVVKTSQGEETVVSDAGTAINLHNYKIVQ